MSKSPSLKSADGIIATESEQKRISDAVAECFSGAAGEKTLQWLERITVKRVFLAFNEEAGRPVTDAELWQQEGMRKLVSLIRERISHGQRG